MLLVVAFLLAGLTQNDASPARAPAASPTPGPEMTRRDEMRAKLLAADTDHDGKWSRAEWTAAGRRERGFAFMDTDRDGYLTPAELMAGMQRLRAMGGRGGN